MPKPPKRKTLGDVITRAILARKYEPPPNRERRPLPGWSGLATDPRPEGWRPPLNQA